MNRYRLLSLGATMFLSAMVPAGSSRGAVFKWDGQFNSLWGHQQAVPGPAVHTNWSPEMLPLATDTVIFNGNANGNHAIDLQVGRTVLDIEFDGAVNYSLNNANLSLGSGDLTAAGSASHKIGSTIDLLANGVWDIDTNVEVNISGKISGIGGITKTGNGALTLSGANTFDGTTNIDAGLIILDHADALQNSVVSINLDNVLDVNTNTVAANLGGLTGSGDLDIGQNLTVGSNGIDTTYSGVLRGNGNLVKTGSGVLTLLSDNTHNGTEIHQGVLQINHVNQIGASGVDLTFDGGELRLTTNINAGNTTGMVLNAGGGTVNTNGSLAVWSGVVGGSGALTKTGSGPLALDAANTFAGGLNINEGVVRLLHSSAAGTGPINTFDALIEYTSGINVANTINLQSNSLFISVATGNATQSGAIGPAAGLGFIKLGAGSLTLAAANTFSGVTHILEGSIIAAHADALQNSTVNIDVNGTLNISTSVATANLGGLTGSGDLDLGSQTLFNGLNDTNTTYSGVITGTSDSILRHAGEATLTLTGGDDITPSSFGSLVSRSSHGAVIVDGARINLTRPGNSLISPPIMAWGGDLTIRNGADVRAIGQNNGTLVRNATLTVTGNGTSFTINGLSVFPSESNTDVFVEQGASVDIQTRLYVSWISTTKQGTLTVRSGGSVSTNLFGIAVDQDAVGLVRVIDPTTSLTANELQLGGLGDTFIGGTATVEVENDALVQIAGETKFWTAASSITIDGATFETDTLAEHTGVLGTISISDPSGGGPALTIGTHDGFSSYNGLIQDAAGGPGSLKKTGAAALFLIGANTYTGETIIDGGILGLGHSASAGTGPITVQGSSIAYANGINIANAIDLQNDVSLSVGAGLAATQSGVISETGGSFGITKTGGGDLTLSAANTFTGDTHINTGKLILANVNALQDSTVHINVDHGLDITTNTIDANLGGLAGSGDLDLGSQDVESGFNDADTEYSGVITGDAVSKLRHQGTGMLTLTGGTDATPSSFGNLHAQVGEIIVDGARIDLTNTAGIDNSALQANGGDVTLRNGADVQLVDGTATADNATLTLTGNATSLTGRRLDAPRNLGDTGSVVVEDHASVEMTLSIVIESFGNGDLTLRTGATVSTSTLILGDGTGGSGEALATDPTTSLSVNFLDLGGQASTFLGGSGTLTIENGAAVQVAVETVLWTPTSSITVDGATFETDRLSHFSGTPSIHLSDPSGGGVALTVGTNNGHSTFGGVITDASGGSGSLKKVGAGAFTLAGLSANTFTGTAIVEAGTLNLNKGSGNGGVNAIGGHLTINGGEAFLLQDHQLPDTATVTVNNSGTFDVNGHDETIASLVIDSGGTTDLNDGNLTTNTLSGGGDLDFGTNSSSNKFALNEGAFFGNVFGTGEVEKQTPGSLTFGGTTSATGAIAFDVQAGTLHLDHAMLQSVSDSITVADGASLTGNATTAGGIIANGTVLPGTSPGSITADTYAASGTSTLVIELAGLGGSGVADGHDHLAVTSNATLAGTLTLSLLNGFIPNQMDEFVILTAGSRTDRFDTIAGAFITADLTLAPLYDFDGHVGVTLKAAQPGDANFDGVVDVADLGILGANFGMMGTDWGTADFNLDQVTDVADLGVLSANWSPSNPLTFNQALEQIGLSAAVPEPATMTLLIIAGLAWSVRGRPRAG